MADIDEAEGELSRTRSLQLENMEEPTDLAEINEVDDSGEQIVTGGSHSEKLPGTEILDALQKTDVHLESVCDGNQQDQQSDLIGQNTENQVQVDDELLTDGRQIDSELCSENVEDVKTTEKQDLLLSEELLHNLSDMTAPKAIENVKNVLNLCENADSSNVTQSIIESHDTIESCVKENSPIENLEQLLDNNEIQDSGLFVNEETSQEELGEVQLSGETQNDEADGVSVHEATDTSCNERDIPEPVDLISNEKLDSEVDGNMEVRDESPMETETGGDVSPIDSTLTMVEAQEEETRPTMDEGLDKINKPTMDEAQAELPKSGVDEGQEEVMDVADIIRDLDQLTDDAGGRIEPEAMETEEGDQQSPVEAEKEVPSVVPVGEIYATEDVGTPVQDELRDYDESSEIQLPQTRVEDVEINEDGFDEVDSHHIELAGDADEGTRDSTSASGHEITEDADEGMKESSITAVESKSDSPRLKETVGSSDDIVKADEGDDTEKSFTVERAASTDTTTTEEPTKEVMNEANINSNVVADDSGDAGKCTHVDDDIEKSFTVERAESNDTILAESSTKQDSSTVETQGTTIRNEKESEQSGENGIELPDGKQAKVLVADMLDVKPEILGLVSKSQKEAGTKAGSGEKPSQKSSKSPQQCLVCKKVGKCKYNIVRNGDIKHLCDDVCFNVFRTSPSAYLRSESKAGSGPKAKCTFCKADIIDPANNKHTITIGTVLKHFCQPTCKDLFSAPVHCTQCSNTVAIEVRDKFCVKAGNRTKNFCSNKCLDNYKKKQKLCMICSKNVAYDGASLMAPVADGTFRDFCSQVCLNKYEAKPDDDEIQIVGATSKTKNNSVSSPKPSAPSGATKTRGRLATSKAAGANPVLKTGKCAVCNKMSYAKHEITLSRKNHFLCSDPCFAAFRYANNLSISPCAFCGMNTANNSNVVTSPHEGVIKHFCTQMCLGQFRKKNDRILPCSWCGVQKSTFEMVERAEHNKVLKLFCTLNCLSLFRVNLQATSNQNVKCDQCHKMAPAQYHLTMSDASVRNFCAYSCVLTFQTQFQQPNKKGQQNTAITNKGKKQPVLASKPAAPLATAQQAQPNTSIATRQSKRDSQYVSTPGRPASPPIRRRSSSDVSRTSSDMTEDSIIRRSHRERKMTQKAADWARDKINDSGIPINPVISDVVSLAPAPKEANVATPQPISRVNSSNAQAGQGTQTSHVTQQIIIQPPPPKPSKNKSVLCKPFSQTKATSCRPHTQTRACQTDDMETQKAIVPIPVPLYIPAPMAMYTTPVPYPVPIPIPIPIPCFIPTTRKSAASILKHVKEIVERLPADPFEAELLMMAEAVATEGKPEESSSESETEPTENDGPETYQTPPVTTTSNDIGEDVLQMALSIASVMPDEPLMDLETSLQPTPIQPGQHTELHQAPVSDFSTIDSSAADILSSSPARRGRSRGRRSSRGRIPKRPRVDEDVNETHSTAPTAPVSNPVTNIPAQPPPDANMVLKYTYGVNAWKHWVIQKNQELQSMTGGTGTRSRTKLYKSDVLQCTADEMNFALIKFVKEVRKPNGEEYAPDSIYYLCLGLQQYLYENNRVDNIFADDYYEQFTETLNEVISNHEVRLNAQGLIVCRIQEEHLWESKQLGAHSPHILLNTLIYFNTKYFMLQTSSEHLSLSFSQIMKHWKKSTHPTTKQQQRHVYLRYYGINPPSNTESGQKRKREEAPVYEQGENTDNPLRCPVKLYEFYLSKCPESIKNRNDVFYLVPERSCVPDSPVWYSTAHLGTEAMTKMLNRVRVVREIQEAHLHHNPQFS